MGGDNLAQLRFLLPDDPAHPLGNELVLRLEVPIQRHLVRPRRLGDRIDADATNPHATEQIVGRLENALTWWDAEFAGGGHGTAEVRVPRWTRTRYLTSVLPIGNMPEVTDR